MEQEKQIEEMTEVVKREIDYGKKWIPDKYEPVELTIYPDDIAYAFYNAGYRKERQGEWSGIWVYTCSACCSESKDRTKYCPHCGAKMKGAE